MVAFKPQLPFVGVVLSIIWSAFLLNALLHNRLSVLGIYPRRWKGLPGIIASPFIHRSFSHLVFNSIPLFVLMNFLLLQGRPLFFEVSLIIVVLTGAACWLFARNAYHIGASGVIMGYFSYLLLNAYYQPSAMNIVLGVLCLYYFGGLLSALLPGDKTISWEGHLFGFLAGIAAHQFIVLGFVPRGV